MRRGQSILEYVFLVGVGAAALIVMLVYVGRSLQGGLRTQADQLGAGQYAPGKTHIDNSETKTLVASDSAGSSTTVRYGNMNEPMQEVNADGTKGKTYDQLIEDINAKQKAIEDKEKEFGPAVVEDATTGGEVNRAGGDIFDPSTGGVDEVNAAQEALYKEIAGEVNEKGEKVKEGLSDRIKKLEEARAAVPRTPDETSTSSYSSASGKTVDSKHTEETLGNL